MRGLTLAVLLLAGCGGGPPPPVEIDPRSDACSWCRMAVSDLRTAAQLVAPLEEPRLFDDLGCLRDYLAATPHLPADAVAYVADHGTRSWVLAAHAVYVQTPALATPMSSGIAAWADPSSRASDPSVPEGEPARTAADIFGAHAPPAGAP